MSEKEKFYPELDGKNDVVAREKMTIEFWRQNRTFEKSVERRKGAEEFVFYDGPPFANGMPHYGHIMISYVKDVVARYQTMRGKRVERRLGWDCHGLPAEMSAEKQLGVSGHKAIEEYGVEQFNAFCRQDVLKYSGIWKETFRRIGRWVDFDAEYRTMDLPFMESVIHNFKELYDKGLVVSQFTSHTLDRKRVLYEFEHGFFDTLAAIKCFDEGVDVTFGARQEDGEAREGRVWRQDGIDLGEGLGVCNREGWRGAEPVQGTL